MCNRIGNIKLHTDSSLKLLETIKVPVEEIEFINPECIETLEEYIPETFSSTLQDSVKVIKYTLYGHHYKYCGAILPNPLFTDETGASLPYKVSFRYYIHLLYLFI